MRKQQPEYELQKQVCQYLELQYPDVLFLSDTGSGIKLTMPQAIRSKAIQKNNFKMPDLVIFEPRRGHHGLFIELKARRIHTQTGSLLKNTHVEAQAESLIALLQKGYPAYFAVGFDEAKRIIDWYLKGEKQ